MASSMQMKNNKETGRKSLMGIFPSQETDEDKKERRVSFAPTARVRVFADTPQKSREETPATARVEQKPMHDNPFEHRKKTPKKEIQKKNRTYKSPLGQKEEPAEMDLTENIGTVLQNSQNREFVEQMSPVIVAKELPPRLSWFLNSEEEMAITENIGKVLAEGTDKESAEENTMAAEKEFPLIKDIPAPPFEAIESPHGRQSIDTAQRRISSRMSLSSRLDGYPTPLFPRTRLSTGPEIRAPSPCIEVAIPDISLKDFLSETGIRFLDGLTSFTRRDTLLLDRQDSRPPTEADVLLQLVVGNSEQKVFALGCSLLLDKLASSREQAASLEEQFGFTKPDIYMRYHQGNNEEKETIRLRLKRIKSDARNKAKRDWYVWRRECLCPEHTKIFEHELAWVQGLLPILNDKAPQIDTCEQAINKVYHETKKELHGLREKVQAYHTMDWARFRELESEIEANTKETTRLLELQALLEQETTQAEERVNELLQKEGQLEKEIAAWTEIYNQYEEPLATLIERLQDTYNTMILSCGWKLLSAGPTMFQISVLGDIPVVFSIGHDENMLCTALTFETTHNDSFTEKCVSLLQKTSPVGASVQHTLCTVLTQLDKWAGLRHDLRRVRFLSILTTAASVDRHVYNATVLHPATQARIDVVFDATEYPKIDLLSYEVVYGPMLDKQMVEAMHHKANEREPNSTASLSNFIVLLSNF